MAANQPQGFYQNQALPLAAATASCRWLYEESGATALTHELTELTQLTPNIIAQWTQAKSDEALQALLVAHPQQYLALLLVGQEVLGSPFRSGLRHALLARTSASMAALEEYLTLGQNALANLFEAIAPGLEAAGLHPRLDQLRVQEVFARLYEAGE